MNLASYGIDSFDLRSSADNYATSLADLSGVSGSYQTFYSSTLSGITYSITYRLYTYNVIDAWDSTYPAVFNLGTSFYGTVSVAAAPEPTPLALAGLGGVGMWWYFRRRN